MKIDERVFPIFKKIDFINRYRSISKTYDRLESRMESFSNDIVIAMVDELGYSVKFVKSERFFKLLERTGGLETQLNFSLRDGSVELILYVEKDGETITVGGPFNFIVNLLGEDSFRYPAFTNYDDLKDILSKSFLIYEDIKQNLITTLGE